MFNELTNAIKAQLYEKAISPLSGAFILSWVIWNYRFILVLVSSLTYPEKISYIDNLPISQQTFLYGIFFPFLSASVLIVLYPYLAKFFYEVSRKWQKELKEVQQKIDGEMPMDQEEARKIRRESLQAEIEFDKELKSKNDEISRLKDIVGLMQLEKENLTPTKEIKLKKPTLSDKPDGLQYDMLFDIANHPEGRLTSTLVKNFSMTTGSSQIIAQHCIDELERRKYIHLNPAVMQNSNDWLYVATKEGRAFLVQNQRPN